MLFLETGYTSLNKQNEELCGDKVETVKLGDYTTVVLADGMGSGKQYFNLFPYAR